MFTPLTRSADAGALPSKGLGPQEAHPPRPGPVGVPHALPALHPWPLTPACDSSGGPFPSACGPTKGPGSGRVGEGLDLGELTFLGLGAGLPAPLSTVPWRQRPRVGGAQAPFMGQKKSMRFEILSMQIRSQARTSLGPGPSARVYPWLPGWGCSPQIPGVSAVGGGATASPAPPVGGSPNPQP